jgi:hypothetical protein
LVGSSYFIEVIVILLAGKPPFASLPSQQKLSPWKTSYSNFTKSGSSQRDSLQFFTVSEAVELFSLLFIGGRIGIYATLVVFVLYFFRKSTPPAHHQACALLADLRLGLTLGSGTGEGRKKSSKAMIVLILIMFLLYTAEIACYGYLTWYSNRSDFR